MIVAVDAAGGDHFPQNPVKGALDAVREYEGLSILLLGPEDMINKELSGYDYDQSRVSVIHAPDIIGMDDSPAAAVKTKQQSSIVVGLGLQKAGKCDAFVSAGNTGALLAASTFILGKLEGVLRPTIAAYFPTLKGFRLIVDAGANLEVKPDMAIQFAKMGQIFCRQVLKIDDPKVGLLNVGEEPGKGTQDLKEIYELLDADLKGFIGNVEGRDILPCKADVFLSDGLVGNLLLKFGESVPAALMQMVKNTVPEFNLSQEEVATFQKLMMKAFSAFNYENVGGIPFLGVNGVSIVGHGGSSALAIKNMIKNAITTVENDVNGKIIASLN